MIYSVPCEGEVHQIDVTGVRVTLLDHDLKREMAMAAMGSDPCACLQVRIVLHHLYKYYRGGRGSRVISWYRDLPYLDNGETFSGDRLWVVPSDVLEVMVAITKRPPWNIEHWMIQR